MKRALVTGAAGFLGRHFAHLLSLRGWEPVDGLDILWGSDLVGSLPTVATRYDLVVHCAAQSPNRAAIDDHPGLMAYNQELDRVLFDWALHTRTPVLYLSSCAVLDQSLDAYGRWKALGEATLVPELRAAGVPATVVRPFSGYGQDQSPAFPFRAFAERARRREDPFTIWGDGQQVRDWIHVSDLVRAALAVHEAGVTEPVSLCTGVGTSMTDLAELMCQQVGYRPRFEYKPDHHPGQPRRVGDPAAMLRLYGPRVSLEHGVKLMIAGG